MAHIKTQTDIFIESCTLYDDYYLTCHDIYMNKSESLESHSSKTFNCAGGFSFNIKNDNRFITWYLFIFLQNKIVYLIKN